MLLLCVAPFCVPTKSNSRLSDGATEALKPDSSGDCPTGTCPIGRCPQGTNPVGPFFDPKKATAKKTVDAEIYSCEPPPGAGEICPVPPTCEEETDPIRASGNINELHGLVSLLSNFSYQKETI